MWFLVYNNMIHTYLSYSHDPVKMFISIGAHMLHCFPIWTLFFLHPSHLIWLPSIHGDFCRKIEYLLDKIRPSDTALNNNERNKCIRCKSVYCRTVYLKHYPIPSNFRIDPTFSIIIKYISTKTRTFQWEILIPPIKRDFTTTTKKSQLTQKRNNLWNHINTILTEIAR